jgi:uncharacterized membrane protein YfcA
MRRKLGLLWGAGIVALALAGFTAWTLSLPPAAVLQALIFFLVALALVPARPTCSNGRGCWGEKGEKVNGRDSATHDGWLRQSGP